MTWYQFKPLEIIESLTKLEIIESLTKLEIIESLTKFRIKKEQSLNLTELVDIEINAWAWFSIFLNMETNLILFLYPKKCIKFGIAYIKINIQKLEELSNFKNRFLIFLYYIQERTV